MKRNIIITILASVAVVGCQEKPKFSCENSIVTEKVVELQTKVFNEVISVPGYKQMLFNAMPEIPGYDFIMEDDHQNIKFKLQAIRTISQDKELGNYECKAILYAEKGGEKSETEIIYKSESTNGGKDTYVQTQPLSDYQVGALAAVMIKQKEYHEKTTRGTIDYGTLSSSVGDFSFATESDVGNIIFDKCSVMDECEVKAKVEETEFGYIVRKVIDVKKIN
ncbi:hypothetical protein [Thiopseudomonas acetoxidans]|uniref:Lipoprotein n=1 Tax=Thiopseudomonas acetoxidans TaxID=3041622 RepID=A0ABT7SMC5_9GAMM|nr:hypothetical protein [Thiopseudomonas sp. CY1220]MDM7857349.1 hypothetical protein [Thiopseudomonas sp. CY1220]